MIVNGTISNHTLSVVSNSGMNKSTPIIIGTVFGTGVLLVAGIALPVVFITRRRRKNKASPIEESQEFLQNVTVNKLLGSGYYGQVNINDISF